jgi:hypothetical protein
MSWIDPTLNPAIRSGDPAPRGEPVSLTGGGGPVHDSVHSGRLWPLVLAAGLGAGVISWLAGEAAYGFFRPAIVWTTLKSGQVVNIATHATEVAAEIRNSALSSGLLGATLGLSMGLAGGLARRDGRAGAKASLIGLSLGVLVGAGTGLPLAWVFYKNEWANASDLIQPMLLHCGTWGAVGTVGGLAFGLGLGGRATAARTLFGGLLGAALGTAFFELAGAILFPLARTGQPLALSWGSRLLARLSVSTLAALGAALAVESPRQPPGPSDGASQPGMSTVPRDSRLPLV